jgi:hypothetical protein
MRRRSSVSAEAVALTQGPGAWGVIVMQRLAAILTVDGPTPRRTSWPF